MAGIMPSVRITYDFKRYELVNSKKRNSMTAKLAICQISFCLFRSTSYDSTRFMLPANLDQTLFKPEIKVSIISMG